MAAQAWVTRAPAAVHRPGSPRPEPPCGRRHSCPRPETRRRCDTSGALDLAASASRARPVVDLYDLSDVLTPYATAWEWQRAILNLRLEHLARSDDDARDVNTRDDEPDDAPLGSRDVVLLVQHPPVVTLGTGSTPDNLKFNPESPNAPFPVHRTERGGEATYHGPGQLVIYPIMNLQDGHHTPDLHWYMRSLEDVAVATMESLGVNAPGRVDGLTGAWANTRGIPGDDVQSRHPKEDEIEGREHKLAAIGVRARRWVTYHGMALNVDPDLRHFRAIVPCGIGDRPVGSVAQMLRGVGGIVSQLDDGLGPPTTSDDDAWSADEALMRRCRAAMLDGFEDVFSVSLRHRHGTPFVVEGDDGRDDVSGTMALSRMKKAELVAEAATRGVDSAGTVQELRARLKMARLSG